MHHVPIEREIDLHAFAPRDIPSVVEEYVTAAAAAGLRAGAARPRPRPRRPARHRPGRARTPSRWSASSGTTPTPHLGATFARIGKVLIGFVTLRRRRRRSRLGARVDRVGSRARRRPHRFRRPKRTSASAWAPTAQLATADADRAVLRAGRRAVRPREGRRHRTDHRGPSHARRHRQRAGEHPQPRPDSAANQRLADPRTLSPRRRAPARGRTQKIDPRHRRQHPRVGDRRDPGGQRAALHAGHRHRSGDARQSCRTSSSS